MSTDLNPPPTLADENRIVQDLINQYEGQISNLGSFIEDENPTYILALSRSGPRLLERLENEGLLDIDSPLITEKALPFMDESEIRNSEFLVFDDILIAGTTMWSWLTDFVGQYNVDPDNVSVVTLAIDEESAGLFHPETIDRLPEKEAHIKLGPDLDHAQVTFNTFLKLDSRRRFQFSRGLIHSLSCINKPYDIDFALFNTIIDDETIKKLRQQHDICDLTTSKQKDEGLERLSLIVPPELSYTFQQKVFSDPEYQTRISKLRIYYDSESGTATFVPIFLLSMDEDTLASSNIFDQKSFGYLNSILDDIVGNKGDEEKFFKPRFRLVWYIVSYLFGVYINQNYVDEEVDLFQGTSPEQHLRFDDVAYLFGKETAKTLVKTFQRNYNEIETEMAAIEDHVEPDRIHFDVENPSEFSGEVKRMYTDITPGENQGDANNNLGEDNLEEVFNKGLTYEGPDIGRISDENNLQGNLAIIFESLYSNREFIAQQVIGDIQGDQSRIDHEFPELVKRLKNGFTVPQLAGILSKHSNIDFSDIENNRRLSLAIDALVDKGEQIPIFYREKATTDGESATWTRAYRHGESAFILYDEFRELMYHVFSEILSDRSLWGVPIEKIAVMVWKSLSDKHLIDDLDKPGDDSAIWVRNTFLPFGHTLDIVGHPVNDISDPEYENIVLDSIGSEFVRWAASEDVDLLKQTNEPGMYTLSPTSARDMPALPSPEPAEEIPSNLRAASLTHTQRVRSLARLLFWIHSEIDPTSRAKYLIGLTSCTDRKTYLHALREEFRALFDSQQYNCKHLLKELSNFTTDSHSRQTSLAGKSTDNELQPLHHSEKLKWPWEQAMLKMEAWDEMEEIISDIDGFFEGRKRDAIENSYGASSTPDLYNATSLPGFLEEIRVRHAGDTVTGDVKQIIEFSEMYALICVRYCQTLWSFYEFYWQYFGDGDENWYDVAKDFNDNSALLGRAVSELQQSDLDGEFYQSIVHLEHVSVPKIDTTEVDEDSPNNTKKYLESVLKTLVRIHNHVESIYDREFDERTFRQKLEDVSSSIWKRERDFVMYWSVENARDPDALNQELSQIQPEITTPKICVAENIREMREYLKSVIQIVHTDDQATVDIGIAAADDVGERVKTDDSFGQVEVGNHLYLVEKLSKYAATSGSNEGSTERAHSLCVSRGVRNAWGGVLPPADQDELKIVTPSDGPRWDEELFDLKDQRKFLSCGWCSFVATPEFLTEKATLDEFNE